jgi:hypothetical protein
MADWISRVHLTAVLRAAQMAVKMVAMMAYLMAVNWVS